MIDFKALKTFFTISLSSPVLRQVSASTTEEGLGGAGPTSTIAGGSLAVEGSRFQDESLGWQELEPDSSITVPKDFDIEKIHSFLSSVQVSLLYDTSVTCDEEEESIDVGTSKPSVKGRQMYVSQRLTFVEYALTPTHLYLRANCEASMKKLARYPGVAINLDSAKVDFGHCTCEAMADQRCAHVACLLYCVEDVALKQPPKILRPSTSQQQAWGKGSTRDLNPTPVHEKRWNNKSLLF